jgi:hypothetical protein
VAGPPISSESSRHSEPAHSDTLGHLSQKTWSVVSSKAVWACSGVMASLTFLETVN